MKRLQELKMNVWHLITLIHYGRPGGQTECHLYVNGEPMICSDDCTPTECRGVCRCCHPMNQHDDDGYIEIATILAILAFSIALLILTDGSA